MLIVESVSELIESESANMNIVSSILSGVYLPALISYLFRSKFPPVEDTSTFHDEYDYIIVGSGPAGSILANRLSKDPAVKILLLEAGKKDNVTTEIPSATIALIGSDYDWFYETTPQKRACLRNKDNKCSISSGKVIGGSSTINYMIHTRGNKLDYDEWFREGNTGWSFEDVLPYFKKYERFINNGKCTEDKYHGCNGELPVSQLIPGIEREMTGRYTSAWQDLGYNLGDPNAEGQIGVTRGYYTIQDVTRFSATTAFLRPVQNRTNLHIVLEAFVHKILINSEKKSVIGVEFEKDGKINRIKAKKEIILSAGVYSSPKILMLSGIGPKEELERFKISVIVDLPGVGKNLQEVIVSLVPVTSEKNISSDEFNIIATPEINKWQQKKGGLLSTPDGLEAYAFIKSEYETTDKPDLMSVIYSLPIYDVFVRFMQTAFSINDEMWRDCCESIVNKDSFILLYGLLRPLSKGTISLNSSDPHHRPIIDPNYFGVESDKTRLLEGLRFSQRLMNTSHFLEKGYRQHFFNFKQCEQHKHDSDEFWLCLFQYLFSDAFCGCCTNKMGPDTDKMAVVDHRLRVKGIKGLRVVDASIFPNQVSALPAATVYMVGEKAAAMIIEDNK